MASVAIVDMVKQKTVHMGKEKVPQIDDASGELVC